MAAPYQLLPYTAPTQGASKSGIADLLRKISGSGSGLTALAGLLDGGGGEGTNVGSALGGVIGGAQLADRAPQTAQEAPIDSTSLFEYLLAQAQGGTSKATTRAATAPHRAAIAALQQALGQTTAQTAQNQADIDSWFGQLGGMYSKNAKVDKRASKKAAKGAKRLGAGLLKGIADPNVARSVASQGQRDINYIKGTGAENSAFQRHQAADAAREGDYYKMVQARLGAQQEADIRTQIASAQAAKVAAKSSAQSGGFDEMLKVLGLVGDNPTLDSILGVGGEQGGFDSTQASALNSSLQQVPVFKSESQGGAPIDNLEGIVSRMYAAASARGLDINDPAVRDAIKNYVAATVLPQYNNAGGSQYTLLNGGFRKTN